MILRAHENFLASRCTRDLYDHLAATHDLLRDWGSSDRVCFAGLFHTVYNFPQRINLSERPTVKALIGRDAEYLVYLLSVIDRPRVFLDGEAMFLRHLWDRHNCQTLTVPPQVRNELAEIEAASLLERGTRADVLGGLLRMGLSNKARHAVALAQLRLEDPLLILDTST